MDSSVDGLWIQRQYDTLWNGPRFRSLSFLRLVGRLVRLFQRVCASLRRSCVRASYRLAARDLNGLANYPGKRAAAYPSLCLHFHSSLLCWLTFYLECRELAYEQLFVVWNPLAIGIC